MPREALERGTDLRVGSAAGLIAQDFRSGLAHMSPFRRNKLGPRFDNIAHPHTADLAELRVRLQFFQYLWRLESQLGSPGRAFGLQDKAAIADGRESNMFDQRLRDTGQQRLIQVAQSMGAVGQLL